MTSTSQLCAGFIPVAPLVQARRPRTNRRIETTCGGRGRSRRRPPQPTPDPSDHEWTAERLGFTEVGIVIGSHGVHGEVRVRSVGEFGSLRLGGSGKRTDTLERFLLRPGRKYPRPVALTNGRRSPKSGEWILRIGDGIERERVSELRGARIFVRDDERAPVAPDEFTVAQIVGLRVRCADECIGVVRAVYSADDVCAAAGASKNAARVANDTLEIALVPDPVVHDVHSELNRVTPSELQDLIERKCVLVPFVNQIVPVVDVQGGFIEIDPPPGLLDIAVVNRNSKPKAPRGLLTGATD